MDCWSRDTVPSSTVAVVRRQGRTQSEGRIPEKRSSQSIPLQVSVLRETELLASLRLSTAQKGLR